MKKTLLTHFVFLLCANFLFAQAPQGIVYQAVARNSSGVEIENQAIVVRISIRNMTASGTIVYSETHNVNTNQFGLFTLNIGTGSPVSGSFPTINWGSGSKFLQTEVDFGTGYLDMGTSQLQSVPYALYAEQSGGGSGSGDDWGSQVVQTDATLTGQGTSGNKLKISQQGATSGQVLKWNGTTWAPATDNNSDAQTLTVSGTTLTISGGNSVTLPTGSGGDDWGSQVVQTDATLTGQGTSGNKLKISQQGATSGQVLKWNGTTWAPAADNGASYTAGNGITISSNTINSTWTTSGTDIYNNNSGNVGLGVTSPQSKLDILGGNWDLSNSNGDLKIGNTINKLKFGIATSGGGAGDANIGSVGGTNRLFLGAGTTSSQLRTLTLTKGVVGINTITPDTLAYLTVYGTKLYGIKSSVDYSSYSSAAVYAEYIGTNSTDAKGVWGKCITTTPGYGIGVYGEGNYEGGYFNGSASTYTGAAYGVYAISTGSSAGTRYGVFGSASGGTTNYGLYCSGNGVYTGTWASVSDRKFKTNIQPLNSALNKVMQLQVKTFEMKLDEYPSMNFSKGTQFGFIAQELQQIIPELVSNDVAPGATKDETIEYLGVNYIGMIPVLTKALQEQQEIIQKQQKQIEELYKLIQEKK